MGLPDVKTTVEVVAGVAGATVGLLGLLVARLGRRKMLPIELRTKPMQEADVIIGCSSLAGMYQVRSSPS
jgi:hypothetical protein